MTDRLYAWTFDPEAFHRWIISRVVRGSELDVHGLRATATEVFSSSNAAAIQYFEALRFFPDDPESWEPTFSSNPDVDAGDELYAIAMGNHLRPTADMSPSSHHVAFGALWQHGWEGDPSFLWWGDGLGTLAGNSGNAALTGALAGARRSLGGWLSVDQARLQLSLLLEARSRRFPDDVTPWFQGTIYGSLTHEELTQLITHALSEFSVVMNTAVDRGEAVRLVLWT